MKIFTAQQIRSWDAYTILHEPISSIDLMERAARACYRWIREELPLLEKHAEKSDRSVKIFCGKGNNGGDGLAIARMFIQDGLAAHAYVLETGSANSPDCHQNLQRLQTLNGEIVEKLTGDPFPTINKTDIVIDALFGTGLNKPLDGMAAELVNHINRSDATVISIDIPSGLYAHASSRGHTIIQARYTLSFQCYKLAFLLPENELQPGQIVILDIGLHPEFESAEPASYHLLDRDMIAKLFRPRNKFAHKGHFGHALLVAGSFGKMGAAVLAAKACLRSGVGLLSVYVPDIGYEIIQVSVPEAMALTKLSNELATYHVAGIGPGLGTSAEAVQMLSLLIGHIEQFKNQQSKNACSLVVDADALNILSTNQSLLAMLPANSILTPHPKEFERLFGASPNDFERVNLAMSMAKKHNCFIVLKGHHTLIACPQGNAYFNNTGNAGMATGGSGDVLTGILTGLAAQGYTALETCLLGVYLHGLAGDKAAGALCQEALIAGDIVEYLGPAFRQLYT